MKTLAPIWKAQQIMRSRAPNEALGETQTLEGSSNDLHEGYLRSLAIRALGGYEEPPEHRAPMRRAPQQKPRQPRQQTKSDNDSGEDFIHYNPEMKRFHGRLGGQALKPKTKTAFYSHLVGTMGLHYKEANKLIKYYETQSPAQSSNAEDNESEIGKHLKTAGKLIRAAHATRHDKAKSEKYWGNAESFLKKAETLGWDRKKLKPSDLDESANPDEELYGQAIELLAMTETPKSHKHLEAAHEQMLNASESPYRQHQNHHYRLADMFLNKSIEHAMGEVESGEHSEEHFMRTADYAGKVRDILSKLR